MIVAEIEGMPLAVLGQSKYPASAVEFFRACAEILSLSASDSQLKANSIKLGCGIDCGVISQVYIFGQWDYLGKAVNDASKLQLKLKQQIKVSQNFLDCIKSECPDLESFSESDPMTFLP